VQVRHVAGGDRRPVRGARPSGIPVRERPAEVLRAAPGAEDCDKQSEATIDCMRKPLAVAATALTAAVIVPAATPARPLTTTPGVIYVLKVTVDDKGIHIPKDKFTKNGITRYPRGAQIRYEFTNKGSKPYAAFVWGADTVVMKPHGGHASLFINWNYRGTFHYYRELHGKRIKPIGTIIIF
jgi:hypothetical protein